MKYSQVRPFLMEEDPKGKVLLVGTAYDGIPRQGFRIKEGHAPEDILGECELAEAYTTCLRGGLTANDVFVYRLNGVRGEMTLIDTVMNREILRIFSIGAGDSDEDIEVLVTQQGLFIQHPTEDDIVSKSFLFEEYLTTKELADAIKRAADFGMIEVDVQLLHNQILSTCRFQEQSHPFHQADKEDFVVRTEETDEVAFSQWYEDMMRQEMLNEAGEVGEVYSVPAEAIVLVSIHPEERPAILDILGEFCALKTQENELFTLGVVNTAEVPGMQEMEETDIDEEGNPIDDEGLPFTFDPYEERYAFFDTLDVLAQREKNDNYKYLHVLVGTHEGDTGNIGVHSAYATMYVQNDWHKSATNKELVGIGNLFYDLKKKELVRLESSGYICIVPSVRRRAVAKKSQHFYTYESPRYEVQPHLLRLSHEISRIVVGQMERFIGEPNTVDIKVSEANLNQILADYVKADIIRDFDLSIERTDIDKVEVKLNLSVFGSVEKVLLQHEVKYQQQEVFRWMDV